MSGGIDVLAMKEDDVTKLLAAGAHIGDPNVDFQMSQYVYKVKSDGVPIINLRKTWEKLLIAARVVAAIENPVDVCVLSNKPFGQVKSEIQEWTVFHNNFILACNFEICPLYWSTCYCWKVHSWNIHQSDSKGLPRTTPSYCIRSKK